MADSSDDSSKGKSSRARSRVGPKKAARIAAGEVRKKSTYESKPKSGNEQERVRQNKREAPPAPGMASRKLALETLIKIETDGAYANLVLNAGFEKQNFSEQDRAFVTALVQGVMRNQSFIDQRIQTVSKESLVKMPPLLRNLLRLAVFQLDNLSETPEHAVLDTSNRLARSLGHEGLVRYTNGVLRSYLRKKQKSEADPPFFESTVQTDDLSSLSIRYSLPVWLIEKWNNYYGKEESRALLEWAKKEPGFTVRVSEVNVKPQTMLDIMNKNGFAARPGYLVPSCLVFEGQGGGKSFRGSPAKLPGFEDGFFVVQDEAAAFVSLVVSPERGETIVDLCAAPGGKSVHLAEILENTGRVVAVDKHESRLKLVKEARLKQGLKNLETVAADGREFQLNRLCDRVLVDAPCSGTGVINRRTDIRTNREQADIQELTGLQKDLITNAGRLVKPGGVLVYSTCSLEPEENIQVIEWFLEGNPHFKGSSLLPFLSKEIQEDWFSITNEATLPPVSTRAAAEKGYMQLIPTKHGVAGFFVCRLKRDE
ncbi:MAG: 16S rRNA (cytosine(967)-C(5))-methyltransferase RsmB [Candidatus Melainabacteria bacterium]|nr:16S rRNA (cytosine(967)-C(5))-methyltransferase RsmB [Candidatus Melainabacteria bacterium]